MASGPAGHYGFTGPGYVGPVPIPGMNALAGVTGSTGPTGGTAIQLDGWTVPMQGNYELGHVDYGHLYRTNGANPPPHFTAKPTSVSLDTAFVGLPVLATATATATATRFPHATASVRRVIRSIWLWVVVTVQCPSLLRGERFRARRQRQGGRP
jgi:hypothetical protein